MDTKCAFGIGLKSQLFLLFSLFLLLFMGSIALLVLYMGPIVLFQLPFSFIYNIFNKKFSVSFKLVANPCNAQENYCVSRC